MSKSIQQNTLSMLKAQPTPGSITALENVKSNPLLDSLDTKKTSKRNPLGTSKENSAMSHKENSTTSVKETTRVRSSRDNVLKPLNSQTAKASPSNENVLKRTLNPSTKVGEAKDGSLKTWDRMTSVLSSIAQECILKKEKEITYSVSLNIALMA